MPSLTKKNTIKPLALALGATVVSTGLWSSASLADNPFVSTELSSGYMLLADAKDTEGKCGNMDKKDAEGKCGNMDKKDAEGKCGNMDKKDTEGKCGNMDKKNAEGKCGNMDKKDAEGKCGNMDKKDTEGKCGNMDKKNAEGKCGNMDKKKKPHWMLKMDTNSDGKISKDEYMKAKEARFAKMDADNNGLLEGDEMKHSHKKTAQKTTQKIVSEDKK